MAKDFQAFAGSEQMVVVVNDPEEITLIQTQDWPLMAVWSQEAALESLESLFSGSKLGIKIVFLLQI